MLARIGGVKLAVRDSDWGGNQKLLMLDVRGQDVTALNRVAEQIAAEVEKVPGAVDVGLSTKGLRPEITVDLDRGLAGLARDHGGTGRHVAPARVRGARRG